MSARKIERARTEKISRNRARAGAKAAPRHSVGPLSASLAGVSLGLAAGFAVWALQVRMHDTVYHAGFISTVDVERAGMEAGMLWVRCSVLAAAIGGVIGLLLSKSAVHRFIMPAALGAFGLYLLLLRGLWGFEQIIPPGAIPPGESVATTPLPTIATLLPLVLAAGCAAVLYVLALVRPEAEPAPVAEVRGLVLFHLCFSLAAAHLMLQLPYYLGPRSDFLKGLTALKVLVSGPWG